MAKTAKRRVKKTRPHQHQKSGDTDGKKQVNWTRIALITIGILIALSMLLSLIITPGTGGAGFCSVETTRRGYGTDPIPGRVSRLVTQRPDGSPHRSSESHDTLV